MDLARWRDGEIARRRDGEMARWKERDSEIGFFYKEKKREREKNSGLEFRGFLYRRSLYRRSL